MARRRLAVVPLSQRDPDEKLTRQEVRVELKISRSTFYEWRQQRKAPRCMRLPTGSAHPPPQRRWITQGHLALAGRPSDDRFMCADGSSSSPEPTQAQLRAVQRQSVAALLELLQLDLPVASWTTYCHHLEPSLSGQLYRSGPRADRLRQAALQEWATYLENPATYEGDTLGWTKGSTHSTFQGMPLEIWTSWDKGAAWRARLSMAAIMAKLNSATRRLVKPRR